MPKNKTNPIVLWLYTMFHCRDDWSVRVVDIYNHLPLETFATPWMCKALWKFVYYNFKYKEYKIVLTHYRYPEV